MKKKILPILLVLCTVFLLAMNITAGSEGGERIAVLAKTTAAIDMTTATKDAAFTTGSNTVTITADTGATAEISATWAEDALYFYIDVNDPNLSLFIQKYAATTGKTDSEAKSDYQDKVTTNKGGSDAATTDDPLNPGHKVQERLDAEAQRGANLQAWFLPAVEIMIDPSNEQENSDSSSKIYQARVCFDGYKMSYVPITDAKVCYNMYSEARYTAVSNCEFNQLGKATGRYQIKVKFSAANLGETGFEDWQMISVHPFMRFVSETGEASVTGYAQFDKDHLGGNRDWNAPKYSFYRLWDPASTTYTGANASEVNANYTESTSTTSAPLTGLKPKPTSTTPTTSTQPSGTTTTPTPATTTAAPAADEGGCGSVIGGAVAVMAAAMIAVPVVLLRKKDDDQ